METLQGKTAFITGAASGIGRALAKALAARGAMVCVSDIDGTGAQRVAAECGNGATWLTLDVCDAAAVRTAITQFARKCGRLDYLFNNAGIGMGGETHEIPLEAWHRVVDINIWGVVHGVQAAYPLMREQGFGHIVNTASMAGLGPAPLLTPYALTKHAVVGLSASLRVEAAPFGVRVSVLCPGVIETPILRCETSLGVRRHLVAARLAPLPHESERPGLPRGEDGGGDAGCRRAEPEVHRRAAARAHRLAVGAAVPVTARHGAGPGHGVRAGGAGEAGSRTGGKHSERGGVSAKAGAPIM